LSDTVNTTADAATETPAQAALPAEAPPPAQAPQAPPTGSSQRTAGWFSRCWRGGLAAAVIVVVAGVFFTIGWFASTGGDHHHGFDGREIRQQMGMREWAHQQGGSDQQDSGQWGRQTPSTQQTPSNGQTPSTPQTTSSEQAYLGVGIATVTPALQQQYGLSRATGVLVASMDGTGPAVKAGIQQGDIIISVDGTAVTTQQELSTLVAAKNAGDSVSVVIDRAGQSLTFQVTLAARPDTISG
jgi:hypothetical protein